MGEDRAVPIPRMQLYREWLHRELGLQFADYASMWRWSTTDLEAFWRSVWDYHQLQSPTPFTAVLGESSMPGATWFLGAQINYARQLKEYNAGRLYLELPLLIGARTSGTVAGYVMGSVQTGIYFTPGVRFNINLDPRISLYVAGGAGLASFNENTAYVGKGVITRTNGWSTSLAGAFGGGLDFRLTRLISLRAEVRDFVSRPGIGLTDGRNHPVFGFGMGFHW